jgi:hypothetical protein
MIDCLFMVNTKIIDLMDLMDFAIKRQYQQVGPQGFGTINIVN